MSDTTPRPDETPGDPTAPPAESAWQPPPRRSPRQPSSRTPSRPTQQPQSGQQPPPAYAGATPGTAVAPPNPLSPTEERTTGVSPTAWPWARPCSPAASSASSPRS